MKGTRWEAGSGTGIVDPDVLTGSVADAFAGSFARLRDAIFYPGRLHEELDLAHFHGRTALIKRIKTAIAELDHGYVVIRGEAGVGKSALAAHLVWTHPCVHHFTCLEPRARIPVEARRNLAAQLILSWGLADQFAPTGVGSPDWLLKIIHAATAARKRDLQRQDAPIVLVVDGLDEAEADLLGTGTGLPLGLPRPESLPSGVYVVATSRSSLDITSRSHLVEIEITGDDNLADLHAYLTRLLTGPQADSALVAALTRRQVDPDWFTQTLLQRCQGVWLYLRYILDEIRTGHRDPRDVASLPTRLRGYYLHQLHRWANEDHDQWQQVRLPLLATLAALRRPATADELVAITGLTHARGEVTTWLTSQLRPFLTTTHAPTGVGYAVRHHSLRDLFTTLNGDEADPAFIEQLHRAWRTAHTAITGHLTPPVHNGHQEWTSIDDYTRTELAAHAAYAGALDQLVAAPDFLTAVLPGSVLRHRGTLTTDQAQANAATLELAADGHWEIRTPEDRQWRLHVWARRTGNHALAEAIIAAHPYWPWTLHTATWAGLTHHDLIGHKGYVKAVTAVSLPDGRTLIASGSSDGIVRLWDPVTGQQVGQPLTGHTDWVCAVAAVPLPNGQVLIATASSDRTVRLWDPTTSQQVGPPLTGHTDSVCAVAAVPLPDGRVLIASGGLDFTVRLWDPVTGQQVGQPLTGFQYAAKALASVSLPDGRVLLATGHADGVVRLWDPITGRQVGQPLTGHKDDVFSVNTKAVVPLPNGRTLIATAGENSDTVRLWDPTTSQGDKPFTGHTDWVNAIAAVPLPDGRTLLATGCYDATVRLWDPTTGRQVGQPLTGHKKAVTAVIAVPLSSERTLIATGGSDATVRLWDPTTGYQIGQPLTGHADSVRAVTTVPLPDGRTLIASVGKDRTVMVWSSHPGELNINTTRGQ